MHGVSFLNIDKYLHVRICDYDIQVVHTRISTCNFYILVSVEYAYVCVVCTLKTIRLIFLSNSRQRFVSNLSRGGILLCHSSD